MIIQKIKYWWKILKASQRQISPDSDWASMDTARLLRILRRKEDTDACLGLHAGNRIVEELLTRLCKKMGKENE